MVGFYPSFATFCTFLAAYVLFQLVSESIGVMCAIACVNSTYGLLVSERAVGGGRRRLREQHVRAAGE